MSIKTEKFTILSKGFDDLIDITQKIQNIACDIPNGIVNVFISSSTASIKILENEPGIAFDLPKLLQTIVPINKIYKHDNLWHEGNGYAHLKAAILSNSISIPLMDNKLALGMYQQIVLINFDNKPSNIEIIVSVAY